MQNGTTNEEMPLGGVEPRCSRGARREHMGDSAAGHTDAQRGTGWAMRQWESILDAAYDAILLTDCQYRIAWANCAASQVLGKPFDEIIGKAWSQAIHGTDQPLNDGPLAQAHRTKKHAEGKVYVCARRVWLEVSANPVLDEKGDITGAVHIVRDITGRRRKEEAMREREEKYKSLFEKAREAILLIDLKGKITAVNRLVEEYGFQRQELIGKRLFDFVVEDHRTRAMADFEVLLGGQPAKGEMDVVTPKGVFSVEYRDNPIIRSGRVVGVQTILTDVTKRKRAERLLREQRDIAQRYLDVAGVMLVVIDTEERVGLINKKGCEILGCKEEDVLGKNWFDHFLPPRVRERTRAIFDGLMARQTHQNEYAEGVVLTQDGRERIIGWHDTLLQDERGQVIGTLSSGEDITERRQAEDAYRSLVDHSMQGLVIFQDEKVVFANQAMAEITGYTIDEMHALSAEQVRDFVHPEDREIVWQNHRRRLAGEPVPEHYELRGLRKDGSVCWLDLYANRIDCQGKPAIQAAYIDVTQRKRAEEALRLSEECYRGIFENAVLGIYRTTRDGEILIANPALVRMLGYDTFEELASRDLEAEEFAPEHPRSLFQERIAAEGQVVGLESAWLRRDGTTLWVRESARAVRDETGKILFYEGTVEDITERKHTDELMRTLASTAMELVELSSEADLFRFIGEKVVALIGEGIVSVHSINGDTMTIRHIAGAKTVTLQLAQRLLGRAVVGMPLKGVHDVARTSLLTGKLAKVEGGLYELFFHTVPRPVCWMLEKAVGVRECHSIGLRRPNRLLGSVTLLTQKRTRLNVGVIEAFVNQASIALERREAERRLRDSEEKYRGLFENAREAIVIFNMEKTITDANKFVEEYGFRKADLIGRNYLDFVAEPYREKAIEDFERLRRGTPLEGEFEVLTPKGQITVFYKDCPLTRGGQVIGVQSMLTDVTERRRAEEALRESEKKYRGLFEDAWEAIVITDLDQTITDANKLVETYGFRKADLIGRNYFDLVAEPYREKAIKDFQVVRRGVPLEGEFEVITPAGQIAVYYKNSPMVRGAKVVGVQSILMDLTQQRRAEEALRESESRYRLLADNASDVIWTTDLNLQLTYCSPSVECVLGYPAEEMLSKRVDKTLTPASHEQVMRLFTGEMDLERKGLGDPLRARTIEVEEIRKDGTTYWVEVRASFLRDADGKAVGIIGVSRDITERKKAERQLWDYQSKLRELTTELTLAEEQERRRIAVGVHDQIGQRLALAKLALQSLHASTSDPNTHRPLEEVCKEIDQVIEDAHMLTFELSSPVLYEAGFVDAVEAWLVRQVHDRHGLQYTFHADDRVATMDKDTGIALFQIVRELLANVVKHAKAQRADVRIQKAGDTVQITVQDDGIGFEPSKVGMPDSKAGGYGLFSIRERLEYLGGSLKIESAPGEGTCISIGMPVQSLRKPRGKEASS